MDSYSTAYSSSLHSASSARSKSTAFTVYSDHRAKVQQPDPFNCSSNSQGSLSTYASTTASQDEAEDTAYDRTYYVKDRRADVLPAVAPSNPRIFASLFPSSRRLLIRHDDSTLDGNMNLRVDTIIWRRGYEHDVTLFHLRMYDLFTRKFSLRRYSRNSGVEMCHSTRKPASAEKRWSILSNLYRSSSNARTPKQRLRDRRAFHGDRDLSSAPPVRLKDTISLEFSNYAHVELQRKTGPSTRYEYEYWSTRYQWRQECRKDGRRYEVSYYLVSTQTSKPIAHILPEAMTVTEAAEEHDKGGWIPPASMWISDPSMYKTMPDIADVIIATGLSVLVDDYVRRHWCRSSFSRGVGCVPKRLVDVLYRRGFRRLS